jgi:hypothetical protein
MTSSDWISLFAALIALSSIAVHLLLRASDKREARHTSVITALQGDKEAVGYEAHRLAEIGWPIRPDEQRQVLDALCLAFIFERSDRTRALIYKALKAAPPSGAAQIDRVLQTLVSVFADAEAHGVDWRLHRAWRRLEMLGTLFDAPAIADAARSHLDSPEGQR